MLIPKSENYCMLQSDFDIVNFHILHGMFLEPNRILGELIERYEWWPKNVYLPQGLMDIERFIFPWTLLEDKVAVEVLLSYRSTIT